ncbi:MAG: hypothetical protein ACJ76P_10840 [Actinomycetota bacterium]
MIERDMPEGAFGRLLDALNEALADRFNARAFGMPQDFVVGAEIEAENEEAARGFWFGYIDTSLDRVGLASVSRYTTRLRFELIQRD